MRVFVTGATGFIGSVVVKQLIAGGHKVLGLARSDASANALAALGAQVHRGTLEELDSLRRGAADSEGVIHTAFDHENFADFPGICEKDRRAIEALGEGLAGSKRPLIITSGVGIGGTTPGQPASEDAFDVHHKNPRILSELAGISVAEKGGNVIVVRLPQVHDTFKQGLITISVKIARETGISAYVGEGQNRWSAVHVNDAARVYVLALERGQPGTRYNAVAEEGVSARKIAEVLAKGLKIPVKSISPEEAKTHFGWMAMFASMDLPASSALTQKRLGWHPTGPGLIADLEQMNYFPT